VKLLKRKSQKAKPVKTKRNLCVSIDEEIIARIDSEKGLASRSVVMNELLKSAYTVKDGQTGVC
jgi:hypothetical protein